MRKLNRKLKLRAISNVMMRQNKFLETLIVKILHLT